MPTAIRKTTALVVLTAYVSAGTLLHWFHDHPAHEGHRSGCARAEAASDPHGGHGPGEPADGTCRLVPGPSSVASSHSCAVCAFLAQKPAPPEPIRTVTVTPLAASVSRVVAIRHAAPPSGPQHPRAPPSRA